MGLSINSNQSTYTALNSLNNITSQLTTSLQQLSTGYRINSAADGAAQLSLSQAMISQLNGSQTALQGLQGGINLLNVADSAQQSIANDLGTLKDLAVQAANGTVSNFTAFNNQFQQTVADINQIANSTQFNGINLTNGSVSTLNIQTGPNANNTMDISPALGNLQAGALGITQASIQSNGDATALLGQIQTAMSNLGNYQAQTGSLTNSLAGQSINLETQATNIMASNSSIRDTDMASASANVAKLQILQQATVATIAISNKMQSSLMNTLLSIK